jgi:segregation and condensation protein A
MDGREVFIEEESDLRYTLPIFEGPLDLLLYLIEKNELDIYDIPISLITGQYLDYLSKMKELNLFIAADFISMASNLIYIKSQMLLPKINSSLIEEEKDPREQLVEQLLLRKKFLEAGEFLAEQENLVSNQFYRIEKSYEEGFSSYDVGVWDLVFALKEILKRAEDRGSKIILIEERNLADKIEEIIGFFKERKTAFFEELLMGKINLQEIVVTFIAILELAKKREVVLIQDVPFTPIRVVRKRDFSEELANSEGG